eukprot:9380720-Pyramimonas_sp.AAC.1
MSASAGPLAQTLFVGAACPCLPRAERGPGEPPAPAAVVFPRRWSALVASLPGLPSLPALP